ncbi:MAG: D-aminoacylase [Desulfuromonadales bacterium]|nr:D-aminoacylase [Desulfuromonadales bacterium]
MYSYLFRGASLIDGSGSPPCRADVAVAGGRIAAVGPDLAGTAERVVNADGLALAPGFIDIHGHSDMTLFKHPLLESKLFQGVTTEVIGNCGLGLFPVRKGNGQELADYLGLHDFSLPGEGICWNDLAGYAGRVERNGLGIHVAPLVGHAPLRIAAMGMEERSPTAAELERMQHMLAEALRQGAWGMSTGLIYPPGSYAATEELISLAGILARHGALYSSHIRGESEELVRALDEAIAIGMASGARVQVSHLKALGSSNRGQGKELLARLARARATGVDLGADQYPYHASATTLTAMVPQWAHAGGVQALLGRLADPTLWEELQGRIGSEMARREGAGGIMVTGCRTERNQRLSGETVARIADEWGCLPEAAVMRLILEEEGRVGAMFFSMAEEDVATILADPLVAVGSDGHGLNAAREAGDTTHPRSYGTFPRVLGRYVREEKLLSLASAIHKMTLLPARRLGFRNRGLVAPGYAADLVFFDPLTVADLSTYADPHRYASGIIHLLVDGRPVVWDGTLTGERPGRVLRKAPPSSGLRPPSPSGRRNRIKWK